MKRTTKSGRSIRRKAVMVVLSVLAGLAGVVADAGPAWATNGTSETTVSVTPKPSPYGTALQLFAAVRDVSDSCTSMFADCNYPEGRVDFWYAATTGDFDASKQFMASAPLTKLVDSVSDANATYCCLPVGEWLVRGFYVPRRSSMLGNFDPSSGDDTITVEKSTPTASLTQSSGSSRFGDAVSFTVQVAAPNLDANAAKPSGFVSVVETLANGTNNLGTAALDEATGQATVSTSSLTVGSHTVTARYAGNESFAGSESASVTHTVTKSGSTGVLKAWPTSIRYGDTVTLTDSVTPTTATGEVTFTSSLVGVLGGGPLAGGGGTSNVRILSTSSLPSGAHVMVATYAGDSNVAGNSSNPVYVDVHKAFSSTSLASSGTASTYGQAVTLTASVKGLGAESPSGIVQFKDGDIDLGAPQPIVAGVATLTTAEIPAGSHTITAVYSGGRNHLPSTSDGVGLTVAKAKTSLLLETSLNPSGLGDPVTFTATVAPVAPGGGTPVGAVQFKDGTRSLGPPVPLAAGAASLSTRYLMAGTHAISVEFAETNNYEPSSDTIAQTVACMRTYTGSYSKLVIPATGSTCLDHASVGSGGLVIPSGARVSIVDSSVRGAVQADGGAAGLTICGSTVTGKLTVRGATDFLLLGDTVEEGCFGNRFNSGVTLTGNSGGLNLGDNTIGGGVIVTNNVGTGPGPNHTRPEIEANSIKGKLECSGNDPVATNDGRPNTASSRTGECAASRF